LSPFYVAQNRLAMHAKFVRPNENCVLHHASVSVKLGARPNLDITRGGNGSIVATAIIHPG
jgi:hypothetical protein